MWRLRGRSLGTGPRGGAQGAGRAEGLQLACIVRFLKWSLVWPSRRGMASCDMVWRAAACAGVVAAAVSLARTGRQVVPRVLALAHSILRTC